MSSRRNFLDADSSIMEKNLRFIKNDLGDNLNQYFGGTSDRSNNYSVPPRDYKVVQPRPVGSNARNPSNDLEKRRGFLLQLGLARHEAYDLAKSCNFEVKHLENIYQKYFSRGYRQDEVVKRILFYVRNEKDWVECEAHEEQSSARQTSPVTSAIYNERQNSNREYYMDRSRSRSLSRPSNKDDEYFSRHVCDQERTEEMFRDQPYSLIEEDNHKPTSPYLDRDTSPMQVRQGEAFFSQQKHLRDKAGRINSRKGRSRSYSPEHFNRREHIISRGRSPEKMINNVLPNRPFSPVRNQLVEEHYSPSRSRSPIRRINEGYRSRNDFLVRNNQSNERFLSSRSRSPNNKINEDRRLHSPMRIDRREGRYNSLHLTNKSPDANREKNDSEVIYCRGSYSSMLDNTRSYHRSSREKSPPSFYSQHDDFKLRSRGISPLRNNPVSNDRNMPSILSLNVNPKKKQHSKTNYQNKNISARKSYLSDNFISKQNCPQLSKESRTIEFYDQDAPKSTLEIHMEEHYDQHDKLSHSNYEQRSSRKQLLARDNSPSHARYIPSLFDGTKKRDSGASFQNRTFSSTCVIEEHIQTYPQSLRESTSNEFYAQHDKPSNKNYEEYGSREHLWPKTIPSHNRHGLTGPTNFEHRGSPEQLSYRNTSPFNSRNVPLLLDINIFPKKKNNFEAQNRTSSYALKDDTKNYQQLTREKRLDQNDLHQSHSWDFSLPRKLQTPLDGYASSSHLLHDYTEEKQQSLSSIQTAPNTNDMMKQQTISRKPFLYSKLLNKEINKNNQTIFKNKVDVQKKQTSADNIETNLKKNISNVPVIHSGLAKPLPGFLKADPRDYWSKWWPRYKYIEYSLPKINPNDHDVRSCLHYILQPGTTAARSHKLMLIEKSMTTIMKTKDVNETNYYTQDIFKLFQYKQHLEDPNFQNILTPAELNSIAPAIRQFQIRTVMAFMHQALIVKWHLSLEIMKKVLAGQPIKSNYARYLLQNKSFHYFVLVSIRELKKMCQQDWPGFAEFYKTIKAKKINIYSIGVGPQRSINAKR